MIELKEAREQAGYTLEEVAASLNIKRQYLADIEAGNFTNLPGPAYVRGYIKLYKNFLGLVEAASEESEKIISVTENKNYLITKLKPYIILLSALLLISTILIYQLIRPIRIGRVTQKEEKSWQPGKKWQKINNQEQVS